MEYIVLILILFLFFNTILKLSFWKWWQVTILSAVAGAFILLSSAYAATQSKTEWAAWILNPQMMQNVAVLVTAEGVMIFAFAFMRLREALGTKVKRYVMLPLQIYPGLLFFPALFFILMQLFFALPGVPFDTVAWGLGIAVFVLLPLLAFGMTKMIPEEDLRLEMQFIVNLFACVIGLITTVNGNMVYAAVKQPFNLKAFLLAAGLFALLFVGGYLLQRYGKYKKIHD